MRFLNKSTGPFVTKTHFCKSFRASSENVSDISLFYRKSKNHENVFSRDLSSILHHKTITICITIHTFWFEITGRSRGEIFHVSWAFCIMKSFVEMEKFRWLSTKNIAAFSWVKRMPHLAEGHFKLPSWSNCTSLMKVFKLLVPKGYSKTFQILNVQKFYSRQGRGIVGVRGSFKYYVLKWELDWGLQRGSVGERIGQVVQTPLGGKKGGITDRSWACITWITPNS